MQFRHGEDRDQVIMLPDCVEDYVPEDSIVRVIDAYVNYLDLPVLGFAKTEPNETGCPMYDPRDMLKLNVYGYTSRVRSSRRLETETKRNLEAIWLMRKLSPDHKTIARFRHDNAEALKNVFRDFVRLCAELGLYGKELMTIDGSKFKAVNSKDRNFTGRKLKDRIARIDAKIVEYMRQLDEQDLAEDEADIPKTTEEIRDIIAALKERKNIYEGYSQELEETGETQKSLTDPDSRLMKANGKLDVCYNVQTAVDSKNKLIVEFEVINNSADHNQITPMVEKVKEIMGTDELTVAVDAGYDSVQDIVASMKQGVDVHVAGTDFDICVPEDNVQGTEITSHKDGRCVYFADRNIALCPMGKVLYPRFYRKTSGHGVFYNHEACKECTCKCTREARGRRYHVPMKEPDFSKIYDDKNLSVRQIRIVPDKEIIRQRKAIAEHPFGTIKRNMDAGYCLMKGLHYVTGEFALTFLAYNLKRAINILGSKKLIEYMTT